MSPLLLAHGWGWDASLWDALLARLGDRPALRVEQGYLGATPRAPVPGHAAVLVGHSAGLCDLLAMAGTASVRAVVSINGFTRFADGPDFPAGVPARAIRQLGTQLSRAPARSLAGFRARCLGRPEAEAPPRSMPDRLVDGLHRLATADLRDRLVRLRADGITILALAGRQDPVVPPALSSACFLPHEIAWHDGPGHMLPLTAPGWCAERLRGLPA